MGLADLKKNATQCNRAASVQNLRPSIDEFIEDAILYALGKERRYEQRHDVVERDNIITLHRHFAGQDNEFLPSQNSCPLKRATFTLGSPTIEQLTDLSVEADVSKSRMLRFLTSYFDNLSPQQRKLLYQQFMVD
ncbi:hypothetical protein KDN34_10925 [Shewanella yunxiaonensis]|uniref:CopG family transcriptional regulator n=1 Tax=Shewanella yunxiaonensis TaxID=2829809 RepID=A0ABX7YPS1_9GAMM|nr:MULTISPECIES: hypothetical protein [Shewanella]MDF0534819.1 hypothetical protein [Shewanella sp. A32]QUN04764.1 hypothetical protein KDN34_10925 [Shewanella yunxiaonensis]